MYEGTSLPLSQLNKGDPPTLLTLRTKKSTNYCPYKITLQNIPSKQSQYPPTL